MNRGLSFQPFLLLLLATICVSKAYPRLGVVRNSFLGSESVVSDYEGPDLPTEFETFFYMQTLDHFNYRPESYATFQQKYIMNSLYWGGANTSSPIFVYTGSEASINYVVSLSGFAVDLASRFKGLLVYIEHRYYGDSMPFGSSDAAYQNTSTLGYFSSTQALADYALVITDLKKNLSAENCPVIVLGGSYGGMLASWFRLKYPHIAMGALAVSAPILYFDGVTPENGYDAVVSKDFWDVSQTCYNTIRQSWFEMDRVAAEPNGLMNLSSIFHTCSPLNSTKDLKLILEVSFDISAQYNDFPFTATNICNAIDGAPEGTDILGRMAETLNVTFGRGCHYIWDSKPSRDFGWTWQSCTEMVMPMGRGAYDTMFQEAPFDLDQYTKVCQDVYGVTLNPRLNWATTEFGGHDIKSVLGKFASNIIFSNGLRDPYSSGGVLENISDSVVAINTDEGSHCLDLLHARSDDPDWLIAQRDQETKIIEGWIAQYNYTMIHG